MSTTDDAVSLDYLIVGTGPAGASLAAFMVQNGLKGLAISRAAGTADTPRAHLFNPFALETLRDIGLDKDAIDHATQGQMFQALRWVRSMVGEEYGRVLAWGAHPDHMRNIARATPGTYLDLPQSYLEPILVRYATTNGFQVRYSTKLVSIVETPNGSLCTLHDLVTERDYKVRAKYVFGADGAHSKVADILDLKFIAEPRGGSAINIIFKADIEHLLHKESWAGLHTIIQPDNFLNALAVMRLVRPWNQWILIMSYGPGPEHDHYRTMKTDSPFLIPLIHKMIGDDTVKIEVQRIDPWVINEAVAETYSLPGKNLFILGDAAHRHPPPHGNGSNTCIQDAYNLAWKVAYVEKGLAGRALLDSYTVERQPVGATIVREAMVQFFGHININKALGQLGATEEEGMKQIAELSAPTPAGEARRKELHDALEYKRQECENLGLAMNQWYDSSAVYLDDEKEPRPKLEGDPIVEVLISTYPGTRLPHAWLDLPKRQKLISTQDLAGHASFCLFIGHLGQAWRQAAANITKATGIPINTYGIGMGLDYLDINREWYMNREVDEDGCVLVRPDRFVAWRSKKMVDNCEGKLQQVFHKILSREGLQSKTYTASR
ncbi:FAD binding domain-containing protein [Xylaria sp. CBS 124048]|nr:FAD binding domain-containing protein [Xylaria sp. CBS 124048]